MRAALAADAPTDVRGAAPAVQRRRRRARRLLGATLVGLLGVVVTGVGAGVGLRHLVLTGWSATAVTGVGVLAAGVGLLGVAAVLSWRAAPGWWRLALLPIPLVALVAGYTVAFAVMTTVVPTTPLARGTPTFPVLLRGVAVPTADGVRLSAWWAPPANGAAVVLLHGAGDNRAATLPQAAVLARHGYGVLLLDARGHGGSGGRGMDLGWYGDLDVRGAVDFVSAQARVDAGRIGVLGLSMGGEEAVGAAAADPRIRAVVAEGATQRTAADKAAWLPGGVLGTVQRGIDALTYGLVDLLTPTGPPTTMPDAVAAARRTQFLVVTAGTQPDEGRAAAALRAVAPERVEVWTVAGAAHTHGLRTAPDQWERRVVGFLEAALR